MLLRSLSLFHKDTPDEIDTRGFNLLLYVPSNAAWGTGIMTELYVSLALLMYLLMVAKYTTQLIFNMSMANLQRSEVSEHLRTANDPIFMFITNYFMMGTSVLATVHISLIYSDMHLPEKQTKSIPER